MFRKERHECLLPKPTRSLKATDFPFLALPGSNQCEFGRGYGNPQLCATTNEGATTDVVLLCKAKIKGAVGARVCTLPGV